VCSVANLSRLMNFSSTTDPDSSWSPAIMPTQTSVAASPTLFCFEDILQIFFADFSNQLLSISTKDLTTFTADCPLNNSDRTNSCITAVRVNQTPFIFWLDPAGNVKISRWNLFSVGQPVNTFSNTVSRNRPSIAYYNNELWMAWTSSSSAQIILASSTTGTTFSQGTAIPNVISNTPPTLVAFKGKLYIFYCTDLMMVTSTTDGTTFTTPKSLYNVSVVPSACVFQDTLYLAFINTGSDYPYVTWATSPDGSNYTYKGSVNNEQIRFLVPVSITVFLNKLYIAYTPQNTGSIKLVTSDDGNKWSAARPVNNIDTAVVSGPTLQTLLGRIYVFFIQNLNQIYVTRSLDGVNFAAAARMNDFDTAPDVDAAYFNDRMWVSWVNNNRNIRQTSTPVLLEDILNLSSNIKYGYVIMFPVASLYMLLL
jgi:hypothetical protein